MALTPTSRPSYRCAALERLEDAKELKRLGRYGFAMYAAGVAVECVLRSFRHADREHMATHDLLLLLEACDRVRLGDHVWRRARRAIQPVHLLWLNGIRYAHEERMRQHLKDVHFHSRVRKGSDPLKVACIVLLDAASVIVALGEERWRSL
jgi:hypothetical protein